MAKKPNVSLHELELEAEKFFAPATEKERAIIDAAATLIGERGIDGATTAEIAKRANVTERTMFRYFPSKADLVRRVLFPTLLRTRVTQQWEVLEELIKGKNSSLKGWFEAASGAELAVVSRSPELARTVLVEVMRNDELREAMAVLWQRHVWQPMVEQLGEMKKRGSVRKDVDVEMLARAVHCLHIGYFLARHLFAPTRKWDDASEIEKMADLLARGASGGSRRL